MVKERWHGNIYANFGRSRAEYREFSSLRKFLLKFPGCWSRERRDVGLNVVTLKIPLGHVTTLKIKPLYNVTTLARTS